MSARDLALALAIIIVWGVNFIAIKIGVTQVPPLLFTGLRFLFSALPLVFFLPKPAVSWRILAAYGFALGVAKFGLIFTAVSWGMPAGLTSLVLQVQAFFTIGFAALALGERPAMPQLLGAAIAFAGIAVVATERMGGATLGPFVMIVAAAAFWGLANVITKQAGRVNMLAFLVWASLVPPLPLFALSALLEDPGAIRAALTAPDLSALLALAFVVYPSTIFGFGGWSFLLSRYPANLVAPFTLLVPIIGMVCGVLVLDETIGFLAILGGVLVLLGLSINVFGHRLGPALRGLARALP